MDSAGHFLFAQYSTYLVVGIFDLLSAKKNRDHGIGHNCPLFVDSYYSRPPLQWPSLSYFEAVSVRMGRCC